jgi:hypothetical protein
VRSDTGSEFREQCCGDYGRGDQADGCLATASSACSTRNGLAKHSTSGLEPSMTEAGLSRPKRPHLPRVGRA